MLAKEAEDSKKLKFQESFELEKLPLERVQCFNVNKMLSFVRITLLLHGHQFLMKHASVLESVNFELFQFQCCGQENKLKEM